MNEEIRQSFEANQDHDHESKNYFEGEKLRRKETQHIILLDEKEQHKLWIRIQRAIQNGEKEFLYTYPGIGEIKVTLTDS